MSTQRDAEVIIGDFEKRGLCNGGFPLGEVGWGLRKRDGSRPYKKHND
jgi:hypothetical protein